jgi:hypothetical protein
MHVRTFAIKKCVAAAGKGADIFEHVTNVMPISNENGHKLCLNCVMPHEIPSLVALPTTTVMRAMSQRKNLPKTLVDH